MVLLRDARASDLPILFDHQRDPVANTMAAFPARELDAFTSHWRRNVLGRPEVLVQTVTLGGVAVGHVLSWPGDGSRLVGYWIAREAWGRGVATAALRAFVAHHDQSRPLQAKVTTHNLGSVRVLEKCGFSQAGPPIVGSDGIGELLFELTGRGA